MFDDIGGKIKGVAAIWCWIGIAACVLISMSGVVFAGNKIVETIEKIYKYKTKTSPAVIYILT